MLTLAFIFIMCFNSVSDRLITSVAVNPPETHTQTAVPSHYPDKEQQRCSFQWVQLYVGVVRVRWFLQLMTCHPTAWLTSTGTPGSTHGSSSLHGPWGTLYSVCNQKESTFIPNNLCFGADECQNIHNTHHIPLVSSCPDASRFYPGSLWLSDQTRYQSVIGLNPEFRLLGATAAPEFVDRFNADKLCCVCHDKDDFS